jgi:hypothetical protein
LLSGENGCGRLKDLEQQLRMRQQYMVAQVAQIYPVRPLDEQSSDHKPGFTSNITKTSMPFSALQLPWGFSSIFRIATKFYGYFFCNKVIVKIVVQ